MAEGVTTTGLDEMRRAIEALPAAVQNGLQEVAQQTAARIATRARQHVRVRSGYTHDQIEVQHDPQRRQSLITVGPTPSHPATKDHPAMLAVWLEYGTRYMSAHPFMRPASDAEQDRYRRDLETASAAIAEQVFR